MIMLDVLLGLGRGFLDLLGGLLPTFDASQYVQITEGMTTGIGWLNWLFPLGDALTVTGIWLGAISVIILAKVVLYVVNQVQPWRS